MSAVTLETLKADYESCLPLCSDGSRHKGFTGKPDELLASMLTMGDLALPLDLSWVRSAVAKAEVFCIARDHGLEAAMLFKLSDGAIDPRGAA